MTKIDRRGFLRATAMGAGLNLLPASIHRAMALPANNKTQSIMDVEHVVILMQENRSFDHYFGTMQGVRGFGDRFTIPQPGGLSVWQQSNGQRTVMPYYLDSSQGNALGEGGPHGWDDAHNAHDHGRITHWPQFKTDVSMGYLKQQDLEFHYALANAFTICDSYHCALHGGTNSNRIFHWTGNNTGTSNSSNGERVAVINNDGWDSCAGTPLEDSLTWTTYPERLQAAGTSWKVYQNNPENYTDNPMSGFLNYRNTYLAVNGELDSYTDITKGPSTPWSESIDATQPLYKGIGNTLPSFSLNEFRADVTGGKLPQISWIVGPSQFTEHPSATPTQGAYYINQILDALTQNADLWSKTVFIVNYDENDCYFDHMPPPNPAPPLADGTYAGGSTVDTTLDYLTMPVAPGSGPHDSDGLPFGPGPRVPMFLISPWSRGGWVNSQTFTHVSVLRFLEQRFGIMEPNITPWRRAVFGDLTSAFDFVNPNGDAAPNLNAPSLLTAELQFGQQSLKQSVPVPPVDQQTPPVQATGTRPSRTLPYELGVISSVSGSGGGVQLNFQNSGAAAAVLHVYDRLHLDQAPRRYTVEAGKQLAGSWDTGADSQSYDLWVLGPNGFHRLLRGGADSIHLDASAGYGAARDSLLLTLHNDSVAPATFTVTAPAYRTDGPWTYTVAPKSQQVLPAFDLSASQGWYDFVISAPGGFTRRYAGRLDNGLPTVSDPAMGADEIPAAFSFADKTGVETGAYVISDPIRLSGFPGYLPVSATPEAEISMDGSPFVYYAPNVCSGQTLQLRHRSAYTGDTPVQSTVTVGSISATFKSLTGAGAGSGTSHDRFGGAMDATTIGALALAAAAAARKLGTTEQADEMKQEEEAE